MKIKHLLLPSIIVVLASCSSAYRIGQTPDDVYYSPAPPALVEYATSDNQQDKDRYAYNNSPGAQDVPAASPYSTSYPYSYNPYYGGGSHFSLSLGYGYNPYDYYGSSLYNPYSLYSPYSTALTFSPYYNSYYSPYSAGYYSGYYNNFYSPYDAYYSPVYYGSKTSYSYYRGPRQYNLNAYNINRVQQPTTTTTVPVRSGVQQPTQTGVGGFVRRIFTPSNNASRNYNNDNGNNNNSSVPVRQMNSSSSSNSNSSSGSGGSAPTRSFRH